MKKFVSLAMAFVAVMSLGAISSFAAGESSSVSMTALNGSGQGGTTTITEVGANQVKVTINIKSNGSMDAQPAHLHKGTCSNANPTPAFPLSNVVDGKSETTVNVSLTELAGNYLVNVHKSASDIPTYVSCGDIMAMKTGSTTGTTTTGGNSEMPTTGKGDEMMMIVLLAAAALGITTAGLKLSGRKI